MRAPEPSIECAKDSVKDKQVTPKARVNNSDWFDLYRKILRECRNVYRGKKVPEHIYDTEAYRAFVPDLMDIVRYEHLMD